MNSEMAYCVFILVDQEFMDLNTSNFKEVNREQPQQ